MIIFYVVAKVTPVRDEWICRSGLRGEQTCKGSGLSTGNVQQGTLYVHVFNAYATRRLIARFVLSATTLSTSQETQNSMIRLTQGRLFASLSSSKWGSPQWAHRIQYHKPSRPRYMATRWIWGAWSEHASLISTHNQRVGQYKQVYLKSTEYERTCQTTVM